MASSSRHSPSAPPSVPPAYLTAISPCNIREEYYPGRVRWPRASRLVHKLLRVTPPTQRAERSKPGPVANLYLLTPVGEPVDAPALVALLREGRVSNKRGRS